MYDDDPTAASICAFSASASAAAAIFATASNHSVGTLPMWIRSFGHPVTLVSRLTVFAAMPPSGECRYCWFLSLSRPCATVVSGSHIQYWSRFIVHDAWRLTGPGNTVNAG